MLRATLVVFKVINKSLQWTCLEPKVQTSRGEVCEISDTPARCQTLSDHDYSISFGVKHNAFFPSGSDQEAVYQRYLRKQTAELEELQQERQRLLEVQQELARISHLPEPRNTVATQVS